MFRTVPLSIIRSFLVYTQQWYMSYRCADSLLAGSGWFLILQDQDPSWSCSQAASKPVWHIPLLCVQWKTPYDGQRNCPKHVEFHSKNKFEKLVHLIGFLLRNLSRCTVTWTSNPSASQHHIFFCRFRQPHVSASKKAIIGINTTVMLYSCCLIRCGLSLYSVLVLRGSIEYWLQPSALSCPTLGYSSSYTRRSAWIHPKEYTEGVSSPYEIMDHTPRVYCGLTHTIIKNLNFWRRNYFFNFSTLCI